MSINQRGLARRSFINGIRLCPPAKSFASSPQEESILIASSMESGTRYSKALGYILDVSVQHILYASSSSQTAKGKQPVILGLVRRSAPILRARAKAFEVTPIF
ncbi:MAG TPA: hypothetical protein VLA73_03980 [Burkholderiales bacterium]|nr:hypothetical protein [Burkholderiales bacterium]